MTTVQVRAREVIEVKITSPDRRDTLTIFPVMDDPKARLLWIDVAAKGGHRLEASYTPETRGEAMENLVAQVELVAGVAVNA